jgi:hypothetical protein
MITLKQHLQNNRAEIMAEAREYAKNYNVTLDVALRDVRDEYIQGYADEASNPDRDYFERD